MCPEADFFTSDYLNDYMIHISFQNLVINPIIGYEHNPLYLLVLKPFT